MSLAKNLKNLLEEKNLTVSEVARKTGVPKSTILSWISEKRSSPDIYQLQTVAEYLGSSIERIAFNKKADEHISKFFDHLELHSGTYHISIKKMVGKI
jgi:transcriptional regulator with XRE-family HTH domain